MRLFLCLVLVAAFSISCVPSASEVCEIQVELVCERFHECVPEDARDETWAFGENLEECQEALENLSECANHEDHDELCADDPRGSNWSARAADKCAEALREMSCEDFLALNAGDESKEPEICKEVCTD